MQTLYRIKWKEKKRNPEMQTVLQTIKKNKKNIDSHYIHRVRGLRVDVTITASYVISCCCCCYWCSFLHKRSTIKISIYLSWYSSIDYTFKIGSWVKKSFNNTKISRKEPKIGPKPNFQKRKNIYFLLNRFLGQNVWPIACWHIDIQTYSTANAEEIISRLLEFLASANNQGAVQ